MTIIAYRNGIMAADTGVFAGSTVVGKSVKVVRALDGTLYGACGYSGDAAEFRKWVRDGAVKPMPKIRKTSESESAIHVVKAFPNGSVEFISSFGANDFFDTRYYASGSGEDYALGALFMGATAVEAVRATIAHCSTTRGPICWADHAGGSGIVE